MQAYNDFLEDRQGLFKINSLQQFADNSKVLNMIQSTENLDIGSRASSRQTANFNNKPVPGMPLNYSFNNEVANLPKESNISR